MDFAEKQDTAVQTTLAESAADDLTAIARLHGKNKSEYLRDLILSHLYGELGLIKQKAGLTGKHER